MEAASENQVTEKRRGRPSVFDASDRYVLAFARDPGRFTSRHDANIMYRQRAVGLLANDSRFAWLADGAAMAAGAKNSWRPGILSELGRIGHDGLMQAVAAELCRLKPKTKAAIKAIRFWRLNIVPSVLAKDPPDPWQAMIDSATKIENALEAI